MTAELPAVPKVVLGRSGIVSTRLGLGSGNWIAELPDDRYGAMLREAFRLGIRHLDTAPSYEQARFARLLRESDPPDDLVVVTKVGRFQKPGGGFRIDFDPDLAVRTVHRNLEELGLEHLPIVKLHDCRPEHLEEQILSPGGTLDALRKLQAEGLIGAIGTACGNAAAAAIAAASGELDIIGSYHHYTLLNREARHRIHPQARRHDLGVINISPWAGNILATGAVPGARYSYREAAPEVLEAVGQIERRCAAKSVSLPVAALAFSLACPDIHVTIIGPVSIEELRQDVATLDLPLTPAELDALASPVDHQNTWF